MANQAQYSYNYMGIGQAGAQWPQSQFNVCGNNMTLPKSHCQQGNQNMSCISMVETADIRGDQKILARQVKGDGAINIAYKRTLVVTRIILFYPTGPTAMFGPQIMAHKIATDDFLFHPAQPLPRAISTGSDQEPRGRRRVRRSGAYAQLASRIGGGGM